MGEAGRRGVVLGIALLAASLASSQEDHAARVRKAEEAARTNAATSAGRGWIERNLFATDRLMILVLNRCLPEAPDDDIPQAFPVYVRLSRAGRAQEIVTELDAELGKCMTAAAKDLPFPEAPREDYWIALNMAAPL
jgi:hypothetical protein